MIRIVIENPSVSSTLEAQVVTHVEVGVQGLPGPTGPNGLPGIVVSDTPPASTDVFWADTTEFGTSGDGIPLSEKGTAGGVATLNGDSLVEQLPSSGAATIGQVLTADGVGGSGWGVVAASGTGDVVGPASAVDDRIAVFDGTTGKLVKDGGVTVAGLVAVGDDADTLGSGLAPDGYVFTADGIGGAAWEAVAGGGSGDVVGPASAVDDRIATFDGVTGKLIQDSGSTIANLATSAQGALADTALQPGEALGEVEAVAGGAGFVNVGGAINAGAVTLDLLDVRVFHQVMTGNIASIAFSNIPDPLVKAASWMWVLRIDATGGYTFPTGANLPTVTWVDGSDWTDLDLSANAQNTVTFWTEGSETKAALVSNGTLRLDPYVLSFPDNGVQGVPITRAETLDLANVTNLELDGTAGTGTITFQRGRSGVLTAASGATPLLPDDVLVVTMASSTTHSVVSIPRTV